MSQHYHQVEIEREFRLSDFERNHALARIVSADSSGGE